MKPRHQLYLDVDLSAQLDALSSAPGTNKSAIVSDALRQYLKHRATSGQDDAVRTRLDRLSRQYERLEQDISVIVETLVVFMGRYFQDTAHLPDIEPAARSKAREQLHTVITHVGRNVALGGNSPVFSAITAAMKGDRDVG